MDVRVDLCCLLCSSLFSAVSHRSKEVYIYMAGLIEKANMSSIEFTLFAPTIAEATLIGSFSEWKDIPMSSEHGTFRSSAQLSDGDHEYKFRIRRNNEENWIDVIDPYVTNYDPTRNTGIITIKNGKKILDEYTWKHDNVKLPDNKDLIIYEIYIADFADNGQFSGVIEKLDYLKDLGINAIEMMPISGRISMK